MIISIVRYFIISVRKMYGDLVDVLLYLLLRLYLPVQFIYSKQIHLHVYLIFDIDLIPENLEILHFTLQIF